MARAGADVIVDDIIFFAEPMFQDGVIAQAADKVKRKGVPYFSAAGNNARDSYASRYRDSGVVGAFGGIRHDFDPGPAVNDLQTVTLGTGTTIFSFQWAEPFFSVSGAPGSASDMDILVYLTDGTFTGIAGATFNIGGDAVEVFAITNSGAPAQVQIGLELFDGPAPRFLKYVFFGSMTVDEFDTASGTVYGHANAAGAEAVGAAFYPETPAFGQSPPLIEPFSSAGFTPILFRTNGTPTLRIRRKPEIVAPDGTDTTFFPPPPLNPNDVEGNGFPNFFGTSAAAPHAAGVAALLLEIRPNASPNRIYRVLQRTAIDMDDPATPGFDIGFDFGTGFGLIDALAAGNRIH